ncbi:MAG: hypothetical protein JWR48_225 [Mycobacterium sp.]|jgi:hypothetical protein|nr:hypothetical protein [Mycobacterium sp.]
MTADLWHASPASCVSAIVASRSNLMAAASSASVATTGTRIGEIQLRDNQYNQYNRRHCRNGLAAGPQWASRPARSASPLPAKRGSSIP